MTCNGVPTPSPKKNLHSPRGAEMFYPFPSVLQLFNPPLLLIRGKKHENTSIILLVVTPCLAVQSFIDLIPIKRIYDCFHSASVTPVL